jgi:hypothetical protein
MRRLGIGAYFHEYHESPTDFRLGDGIIKTEYLLGDMINQNKENNPFRYPSVRRSIEKAELSTSTCEFNLDWKQSLLTISIPTPRQANHDLCR